MKIYYFGFLLVLAAIGIGLNYVSSNGAGKAYTQGEDGNIVESDGSRPNGRTEIVRDNGSNAEWLTKWVLTERSGKQVGTEDLAGQPFVAGFFFSTCPGVCPRQNAKVKELQDEFTGQAVRFLSISCDPEVDTPDVLVDYANDFDADPEQWLFLTGEMKYIKRIGVEYFRLPVRRKFHANKFALFDKDGEPVGMYDWEEEKQWNTLREDISKIIAAGETWEKPVETDSESGSLASETEASTKAEGSK